MAETLTLPCGCILTFSDSATAIIVKEECPNHLRGPPGARLHAKVSDVNKILAEMHRL